MIVHSGYGDDAILKVGGTKRDIFVPTLFEMWGERNGVSIYGVKSPGKSKQTCPRVEINRRTNA